MRGVLVKPPARSLIVAHRMPNPPKSRTSSPFTADGDMVIDCDVPGCGWHAMGPRPEMGKAQAEHYRQFHASAQVAGVFRINNPR